MTRRVAVTGTPGTGKTTATERLDVPVCHLNRAIREEGLAERTDADRDSLVADLDAVERYVDRWVTDVTADDVGEDEPSSDQTTSDQTTSDQTTSDQTTVVIDSHLAHLLPADCVVVCRCRPDLLADRLRERGESDESVAENRESEALDVIAGEVVERHPRDTIYEIDTTDRDPSETTAAIREVIAGDAEPRVGTVDFLDSLHD